MLLFLIIGFPIVFIILRTFLEETWPLTWAFGLGAFGYIYPNLWLDGIVKQRQNEIILNMPFVVDMLALSIFSSSERRERVHVHGRNELYRKKISIQFFRHTAI